MIKTRNFIIIDVITEKALYGVNNITLRFSEEEIAEEVAEQFFENKDEFIVCNILEDEFYKLPYKISITF